ncbi:hypothetical protein GMST_14250 [Geomonas silvestris]|uniref:Wadjet protein JetD C-terminal domain-containing protein n=1 Tax=Geomonas silvestris TaxID=2740184 RepID=A0A6V8MGJ1_9BACT|nr:Wadjet anti-phage system protein JetD domain-containing protein [Geomonas silvestris]GFO59100.1 hypothetical protein GMST_14250 [Geomonas silvestris]
MDQLHIENIVKDAFWKVLGPRDSLQGKSLAARLSRLTGLDELTVRGALGGLSQQRWLGGVSVQGISLGKVFPLADRPGPIVPRSLTKWVASMIAAGLGPDEVEALRPLHNQVEDLEPEDQAELVKGLLRLRAEQAAFINQPSFLVSAKFLLGASKILDQLAPTALKSFGINTTQFTGSPSVLLTAGPPIPKNVVLVENPHAFWRAITCKALETTAFVVTFGYGLSRHSDDYGNQLAALLEGQSALLGAVCAGNPPDIRTLLNHSEIAFWGDLDIEGVKIFRRLQSGIPRLQVSALYIPMIRAALNRSTSHPYIKVAAKHKQQRPDPDGEDFCRILLEACRFRAVDQEIVTVDEIIQCSDMVLEKT